MAALDAVRAKGIVDDHRLAVSGWSYGGIMTAWMITHYHIFAAAVSGASVNDWTTDYSIADDMDSDKALFHGSPYVGNNRAEWNRASSVNFAKDVTTPTLIISDNGDNRDPIPTSYMFYRALVDNHKDVTFVAYPVPGHFPRDPVRQLDVYTRWLDYVGKHF
jgi:dipeptidyl aminopeptidase/acylaminoacyl peptidase